MLGTLPRERVTQDIHRFANITHVAVFATDKGFTLEEVAEIMRFNRDDVIKDLMKAPFQRKAFFDNKFGPLTRFSNGEWPVSYGALGRTTAGKEVAHHYGRKAAGNAAASRPVHYSIVRCRFSGEVVDLRPKLPAWPQLISANYTFCNGLGKEAHGAGLGAFLAPSAQHTGGTTVPVFIEGTLSSPVIEATARLTFGGSTLTEIMELPGTQIWP
jgi:RES domain